MAPRKKSQDALIAEIKSDIQMTVARRAYAYASELAGWLDHAAKLLCSVEDNTVRIELFLKIVLRALKLLLSVDYSNGALQSVIYEGSYCFDVWKQICAASDPQTLQTIVEKILLKDEDCLALSLFFPSTPLPLAAEDLRLLLDDILQRLPKKKKYHREAIASACLLAFAQLKDEEGFNALVKAMKLTRASVWEQRFTLYLYQARYDEARTLLFDNTENRLYARPYHLLTLFQHSQDRAVLHEVAQTYAAELTRENYKRIAPFLNEEEHAAFIDAALNAAKAKPSLDIPLCELLFNIKDYATLRNYLTARYDAIFSLSQCTGMVPLAKKLTKVGGHLSAVILLRGAIIFLMDRQNSKYYDDVHRHYQTLNDSSRHVTDWQSIPPPTVFNDEFTESYRTRRTFW
jgi:hypothetical protein